MLKKPDVSFFADAVCEKIEAQQKALEKNRHAVVLGGQIKDLVRADEDCARLIGEEIGRRGIDACEKELAAFAHKHGGAVTNDEAEDLIRRFYGLPERTAQQAAAPAQKHTRGLDLAALLADD